MIKQIGLPLCGRPILLITRMITDRIGLHSVLLPLLITIRINCKDIEEQIIGLKDAKDVFVYRKYSLFLAVVLKYLSHDNNCFSFYFRLLHTEESTTYDDLIK